MTLIMINNIGLFAILLNHYIVLNFISWEFSKIF